MKNTSMTPLRRASESNEYENPRLRREREHVTCVSWKRYRSQMLRPPTRRTHARPTGFSSASKSEGPGGLTRFRRGASAPLS